jgi:error-prone DNA polymerase
VAAVRPGVGVNDGVSEYIRRRNAGTEAYDHPLERPALQRTRGIILFQDQFNEVAMSVAGFSSPDAERMRRGFLRSHEADSIPSYWWPRFREGAASRGVNEETAQRIFRKFNGQYMFPESHAFAFGVTAYQMAWLKCYYPLEFFVGLFNEQPMGFYNLETLKEDAKRHGISILHPQVNRSAGQCAIENEVIRLGLLHVRGIGAATAETIVQEREANGPYTSLADLMERTGLQREALDSLADAGALDHLAATGAAGRRDVRWEVGLRYRPVGVQPSLRLPVGQDMVQLPAMTSWELMAGEYRTMGLHPGGHLMAYLRPRLPGVLTSEEIGALPEGAKVRVAGLVIRRQRPLAKAVFITLEDEIGHLPVVVWPQAYARYRQRLKEPVLLITGTVSRRDGTMNIVLSHAEPVLALGRFSPPAKNWG